MIILKMIIPTRKNNMDILMKKKLLIRLKTVMTIFHNYVKCWVSMRKS